MSNLTWLFIELSKRIQWLPSLHEVTWETPAQKSKQDGRGCASAQLQRHNMTFKETHSIFFSQSNQQVSFSAPSSNTFYFALFSLSKFPNFFQPSNILPWRHLRRFSWRSNCAGEMCSSPDMSHVKGPLKTLKVKGSSLYCCALPINL